MFKMLKLTVVRSLIDFLEAANIPYIVTYSVQSTEYGFSLTAGIKNYLCFLTFYETMPANNGLDIVTKEFPNAQYVYNKDVRTLVKLEDLNNLEQVHILAQGTEFQEKVWKALLEIPRGSTVFYSELATMASVPGSIRACASAIGKNPVSLLLPCHRVIGKNGNVCKFGSGEIIKRRLWKAEGISL